MARPRGQPDLAKAGTSSFIAFVLGPCSLVAGPHAASGADARRDCAWRSGPGMRPRPRSPENHTSRPQGSRSVQPQAAELPADLPEAGAGMVVLSDRARRHLLSTTEVG